MPEVQRIGRYEILRHIATGGMGQVFLARTTGIGGFVRHVVIKTLEVSAPEEDAAVAMFLDEARVAATLHHHHIPPVFEVGREGVCYYLVMDYVHGHTAQAVWERTFQLDAALPLDFALSIGTALASALHYVHTQRATDGTPLEIVHRDVTLENVLLGFDGGIKLIDFGIAKAANRITQTQTGFVKGKVGSLAPEQILGTAVDHRADIFALGVMLYELTTMTRAFREASDQATIERIKRGDVIAPSQIVPGYSRGLELIVLKALRTNPEDRFQDADVLRRELDALGHRQKLILGDAAIIEVMSQLYDRRDEPWQARQRLESELAIPVERTPEPSTVPHVIDDHATMPVPVVRPHGVRNLRAATEVADQMVIEVYDEASGSATIVAADDLPTVARVGPIDAAAPAAPAKAAKMIEPAEPAMVIVPPRRSIPAPMKTLLVTGPRGASSRWPWVFTIAIVGFAAFAAFAELLGGSPSRAAPAGDGARPRANVANPSSPDASLAPVPPVAPDATPEDAAARSTIQLRIKSTPSDATVLLDGQKLGHTPYEGSVPAAPGPHVLKLRRHGYVVSKLDIDLTDDVTRDVVLKPGDN